MHARDRTILAALGVGVVGVGIGMGLMVTSLCPAPMPGDPCPDAARNQALVVAGAGLLLGLVVTAAAFVTAFAAGRRIAYHGAWGRAARRGALTGLALVALAGLRLMDALNLFSVGVVVGVAAAAEWVSIRRLDGE